MAIDPAPTTVPADDVGRIAGELTIPPCPAVLAAFSAEAAKDDPDTRKLGALIAGDAGLASALIKVVNSPLYGLSRKAADVESALAILGLRATVNLISTLLLRQAFPAAAGALMQRYWDASTSHAEAAVSIATRVKGVSRGDAHSFALFRNCGMAVMIARFPDYASIFDAHESRAGADLIIAEEARYRYNHARVGYALARGWLLPDAVCRTILLHHDLASIATRARDAAGASPQLAAIALLAEQIAALHAGREVTAEWAVHERFALDALGLAVEDIVAIAQDASAAGG